MRKILLLAFATSFLAFTSNAQLEAGDIAPNFTATDINGNTHNLYDILAEGKAVLVDGFATWCGPCWAIHQDHVLEDIYALHGPSGDNTMEILSIEMDNSTGMDDLNGLTSGTAGDWVTGTEYPIIDDATLGTLLQVSAFPTFYIIWPNHTIGDVIVGYAGGTGDAFIDNYESTASDPDGAAATNDTDAKILSYDGETAICAGGDFVPVVTIQNYNADGSAMTAASFETWVDGSLVNTDPWTGNLEQYYTEQVTLSPVTGVSGAFMLEIVIVFTDDEDTTNNSITSDITLPASGNSDLTLTIQLDSYPEETGWRITDNSGNMIAESESVFPVYGVTAGVYDGMVDQIVEINISAPTVDCFNLLMFDSFGDAFSSTQWGGALNGSYELSDGTGAVLASGGGTDEWAENNDLFGVSVISSLDNIDALTDLNVYPNPASNNLTVSFDLATDSQVSFEVFNLLGERVYVSAQNNFVGNNSVNIDVTSLTAGMYTLNMIVDGAYTTTKVTITK